MSEPCGAPETAAANRQKLIVALDVESVGEARDIIAEIGHTVGAFKIGLQLFTSAGGSFVREIIQSGTKVFLDLKFHDIPNTVAKAGIEAARMGVWMFNVHASGGSEMMRRVACDVADLCQREELTKPNIIAVTVLTSSDSNTLREIGTEREVKDQVLHLARMASECGLDGVVASANETGLLRESIKSRDFLLVTPGIRPTFATNDDQRRVMTPGAAISSGADYLVIGRPVIKAADRLWAVKTILGEMEAAST
ncbi:MAG: orotidine-5'-phosphate decarboxylase [Saprospiraceae bacterium]|nr:orotidine-5'-phosphate decarboxylase [Pyrinomonadaceae bacterium]